MVSAGADLPRRLRGWRRRHLRGRRGDVQVRNRSRMGGWPHRGARRRRHPLADPRPVPCIRRRPSSRSKPSGGTRTVRVPALRMPDVPKKSAGYFVAAGDGSRRSLHRLRRHARRDRGSDTADRAAAGRALPRVRAGAVPRRRRSRSWPSFAAPRSTPGPPRDANGIDVSAIEHLDARSIQILREDGVDRKLDITLPAGAAMVLLIDLELSDSCWRPPICGR